MPDDVFASIALGVGRRGRVPPRGRHTRGDTVAGAGRSGAVGAGRDGFRSRARGGTGLGRDAVRRGRARRRSGRGRGDRPRRERRAPVRQGVALALVQGLRPDAHAHSRAAARAPRLPVAAGRAGRECPVSEVVIAGVAGRDDTALLVLREPQGVPLTAVEPERITDAVLDDAWPNIARLHDVRIAHGGSAPPTWCCCRRQHGVRRLRARVVGRAARAVAASTRSSCS